MKRSPLLLFFLIWLLSACLPSAAQQKNIDANSTFDSAKLGTTDLDITYCSPQNIPQKLDFYYPSNLPDTRWPVVVYIHGGGWQEGDKANARSMPVISDLQKAGFLVASINYRLAPQYPFPAQIKDARCAIRFLRVQAEKFNINPELIGVMGDSAGGHLAALLGLANSNIIWDTSEYYGQSSRVQAIVDLYGISDLTKVFSDDVSHVWQPVFNASQSSDYKLRTASPLTYVHPGTSPFLIIHGDQDRLVPFEQSQTLFNSLKGTGDRAELVTVKNADHGFAPTSDQPIQPDSVEINKMIVDFFIFNLK